MPYSRKRVTKKIAKKKYPAKKYSGRFVKAVRAIAMGTQETKSAVNFNVNADHYHNGGALHTGQPGLMIANLLATQQGISDNINSNKNRIGDCILPVGVKLLFQIRQFTDRPNVNYKVWIVRHTSSVSPASLGMSGVTGNLMLDSVDTERADAKLIKVFRPPQGMSLWTGEPSTSKEVCYHRKIWMPLPRSQYSYNSDGSTAGKEYNLALYVGAYDTSGTLLTDVVCQSSVTSVLYFKDS